MSKPNTDDEALLARVKKEQEHGFVLEEPVDDGHFHGFMKRLIETPAAPKPTKKKQRMSKKRRDHID